MREERRQKRWNFFLSPGACAAQVIVDPARFGSIVKALEPQADEKPLRCEVTPIRPSLNFGFRFQAGYVVSVPMNQYSGTGHGWSMVTRITPEGGGRGLSRAAAPPKPTPS